MKSYYLCFLAIVALLSFSSCSHDKTTEEDIRKEVKITATFRGLSATSGVTTRVTDNSWDEGDAIGLFMKSAGVKLESSVLAENVKYTAVANSDHFVNTTEHKVYFPNNKEEVDFISYYPYKESLDQLKYPIDILEINKKFITEFMYSANVKNVNSELKAVSLDFSPQLVRVILRLKNKYNGDIIDLDKNDIEVKITNVHTKSNFVLSDGTFEMLSDDSDVSEIIFNINENTAEALLLPESSFNDIILVITNNGNIHSLPLYNAVYVKNELIESFIQSHEYEMSISLAGANLDGGIAATIKDRTKIIVDEIIIPEDSTPGSNDDSENKEDPDGEDTEGDEEEVSPGDEGEIDPDEPKDKEPDPDNPSTDPVEGDGSKENPYSIAQVIGMKGVNYTNKWVKGYIVGSYISGASFKSFTSKKPSDGVMNGLSLALADSSNEESHEATLPVDLMGDLYKELNLKDNYGNLGKELLLRGYIEDWRNSLPSNTPRTSVTKVLSAYIDDVKIGN